MKIEYPTWKVQGQPTPAETLYVCDKCGKAEWSHAAIVRVCHTPGCEGRKGGPSRMRLATMAETEAGKRALQTIIGDNHGTS